MKILLRVFLVLLLVSVSVSSDAVIGRGVASCGQWVKDRSEHGLLATTDEYWLLGFLSGIAVDSGLEVFGNSNNDNDSLFLWVDNYCKAHPLDSVGDAGRTLVKELARRQ